jgi:hypothetical protein
MWWLFRPCGRSRFIPPSLLTTDAVLGGECGCPRLGSCRGPFGAGPLRGPEGRMRLGSCRAQNGRAPQGRGREAARRPGGHTPRATADGTSHYASLAFGSEAHTASWSIHHGGRLGIAFSKGGDFQNANTRLSEVRGSYSSGIRAALPQRRWSPRLDTSSALSPDLQKSVLVCKSRSGSAKVGPDLQMQRPLLPCLQRPLLLCLQRPLLPCLQRPLLLCLQRPLLPCLQQLLPCLQRLLLCLQRVRASVVQWFRDVLRTR